MRHAEECIWSCTVGCLVMSNTAWFHLSQERLLSKPVMELYLLSGGFTAVPPPSSSSFTALELWQCREWGQGRRKVNANSYWQTFSLFLCTAFSRHVFEVVKRLEDGTVGAEEPGALYAQDSIAAEWLLNPSSLNSWPRKPSWGLDTAKQHVLPSPPTFWNTDHLGSKRCQDSSTSPTTSPLQLQTLLELPRHDDDLAGKVLSALVEQTLNPGFCASLPLLSLLLTPCPQTSLLPLSNSNWNCLALKLWEALALCWAAAFSWVSVIAFCS